ncbi:MAG: prolyl-tRNA synthetase [Candidatus Taylorbacteria bacterium RIFOXYD2_FULL_36_9]|uniref:Proline--tRNA ligase n=1 Tax=Candidatus Taylorbacteria bacterium RIFOXYD2_FULL_36_9 TaxID=1802338 RepID=A0A1G2PG67_9BACT|nr:MAG: prolyl-tRNA synthetase [Candidatus Taylorbacteria bacterium RIFOXYD2_FULL_36_9]
MYQSKLFSKTRKEAPKDEVSKNAELLIKAGFINKEMAGVYSYLPLGLRVLNKINNIIREEMNQIGGQEIFLTSLQEKETWEKTNRWDDKIVDNWFKTKLKNETELGLAFTHEEALTRLMKDHIRSYKDLPSYPYQIQTKFRNEARAKSGIIRCREFLMKDMYSFSRNEKEHLEFYEKAKEAYKNIFKRVGLGDKTYLTFASGGSFSKYSHEFQTITDSGEDIIYLDEKKGLAVNKEVLTGTVLKDLDLEEKKLKEVKAVEVGNIFTLGTKFSEPFGLTYLDEKGEKNLVFMGSYGIGPGRVMGTVAEALSDNKGLVWPSEIAPFYVHLIEIGDKKEVRKMAEDLYKNLQKNKIEVLFDDRDLRPGEKFADSDLLGIPLRIIVSEKTLASGEYEIKERASEKVSMIKEKDLLNFVIEYK